ncbi:hypothetical protein AQS8620_02359 [Aquimixticola soesokkakensis]|uniref:Lysophospholipase n=1 Tax=Aquimixticola soesokkakensis TaxID=1519096 RepID=A0A1Y5T457_9RHOB|nr:DUF1489 domain-containing protein [Aquimixticola soesokkakensis]SLN53764.1 hypothetical protein AQS8620_02359 [Aquimixticola soesokkakensis]
MSDHINLVKLCVGIETVEQLAARLAAQSGNTIRHVTRMRPKEEARVLAGGSLFWVIKGVIQARQEVVGLEAVEGADGIKRCAIVLAKPLIRTQPAPRRAFQGWRYLKVDDSPPDLPKGRETEEPLPAELAAALAELGLR